jgi:hypothetical protein
MMDDLDALKAALKATPEPRADAKAAAMRWRWKILIGSKDRRMHHV